MQIFLNQKNPKIFARWNLWNPYENLDSRISMNLLFLHSYFSASCKHWKPLCKDALILRRSSGTIAHAQARLHQTVLIVLIESPNFRAVPEVIKPHQNHPKTTFWTSSNALNSPNRSKKASKISQYYWFFWMLLCRFSRTGVVRSKKKIRFIQN